MGKKKKPATDSKGHDIKIYKSRELTKPPMVMKDKTKYNRKEKHKNLIK